MSAELVTIGRVGAPHGIEGALRLQLFLEHPEAVFDFKAWHVHFPEKSDFIPFQAFKVQEKGNQFYIRFDAVKDRDQARQFTHALLAVPRSELPPLDATEYYWSDLEGLSVYNTTGVYLGTVDHLIETGANDVLVLKTDAGTEMLIPYVYPEIVIEIDLLAKKIVVDWEGR